MNNFDEIQLVNILAKGSITNIFGKIGGKMLFILLQFYLARILSVSDFGVYATGWTLIQIVGMVSTFGLDKGMIRFGVQYADERSKLPYLMSISIISSFLFGSIIGLLFFWGASWIAENIFQKEALVQVIKWFSIAVPFAASLKVCVAATRIRQNMNVTVLVEDIGQPLISWVFIVFLNSFLGSLQAVIISSVLSFVLLSLLVSIGLFWFLSDLGISKKNKINHQDLFVFSLTAVTTTAIFLAATWVDRLLVARFLPLVSVGIYQAVSQVSVFISVILAALNTILTPMIASLYHRNGLKQLERIYRISTKWGVIVSLPVCLVICFFPQDVLTIMYGKSYIAGAFPLIILTIGQMINVTTGAVGLTLTMTGYQNKWLVSSILAFLLNFVLCVILIPRYGVWGAATSAAGTTAFLYLLGLYQVKETLGIWPYDTRYKRIIFLALLSLIPLWLFSISSITLVVFKILGAIISVVLTMFLGLRFLGLDEEDKQLILLIKNAVQKISL